MLVDSVYIGRVGWAIMHSSLLRNVRDVQRL